LRRTAEDIVAAARRCSSGFEVEHQYPNMKRFLERAPDVVEVAERGAAPEGLEPVREPIRGGTDGCVLSAAGLRPRTCSPAATSTTRCASGRRCRRWPPPRRWSSGWRQNGRERHGLRALRRPRPDPPYGARLRRGRGSAPVAEELDRTKSFPYDIVRKLGDLGLMGIPFPEEYGGAGA
jgi:hypothetical protein